MMPRNIAVRMLVALILIFCWRPAHAAERAAWTAALVPADARAGEMAQVVVTAKIDATWHVYSLTKSGGMGPQPTTLALPPGGDLTAAGAAVQPAPKRQQDPNFGMEVEYYEGSVAFGLPVRIKPGVSGARKAEVTVTYMACSGSQCMPPSTVKVPISFTVAAGSARADHAAAVTSVPAQPAAPAGTASVTPAAANNAGADSVAGRVREAEASGLPAFIWLSVVMGFLALLTPCVFPMVPITVSFFAKRKEQGGRSGIGGAAAYSLGIITTFTAFGLLMTALFGATGIQRFATNPLVNIALAILFIALAANLFGVFELVLPSGLVNSAQAGSRRAGLLAPVLMGLTFTLTSFTCTAPFVGTLLVTASQGSTLYPLVGMLAFSTAFAAPFFFLALFPQYLARMPKSGSWLTSVKVLMGFLELAAALKFLSNADLVWQRALLTRPVFLAIWAIIGVIAGLYMLGWIRLGHDDGANRIGWVRRLVGVGVAVLGVYCLAAMQGAPLGAFDSFLPPAPYPAVQTATAALEVIPWMSDYQPAVERAKREGKPLLLNFTGVTCTNCRYMEQHIFPLPQVAREVANFVPVELYTDRAIPGDRRNQALQKRIAGDVTLPLYAVVSPDGRTLGTFPGLTYKPEQFIAFLQKARGR